MNRESDLAAKLKAAWATLGRMRATDRPGQAAKLPDGLAFERCRCHVPPFDAVETTDPKRKGWLRTSCRRCGQFLGYRPAETELTIGPPKLGNATRKPE
jgi:hypothetical protein